jgi:hypothetical protein
MESKCELIVEIQEMKQGHGGGNADFRIDSAIVPAD